MTTIKEEILNMIGMNCNFEFKVDSLDFLIDDVYQWHIQQQIKLLEEVNKAIVYSDLGKGKLNKKMNKQFKKICKEMEEEEKFIKDYEKKMTTNNLTLDNWKERLESLGYKGLHTEKYRLYKLDGISEFIEELLSTQKTQLIEQFKNMESMKKEKIIDEDDTYDYNNHWNWGKNQKIDEILKELKVIEEEK